MKLLTLTLAVVSLVLVTLTAYPNQAALAATAPTQVIPDSGVSVSDYRFELLDYSPKTYITFGQNFYADAVSVFGTHVNFTNTSIGSANTMTKNFGLGVEGGNGTVTDINASFLSVEMSCPDSATCYAYYYYLQDNWPYSVQISSATTTVIPSSSFYTDAGAFDSAQSPVAYHDTGNKYVKVKIEYESETTITFASGVFIYADLGFEKSIKGLTLDHRTAAMPKTILAFVSDSNTDWGEADFRITLAATADNYEYEFDSPVDGRYLKLEVVDWGPSASQWQLDEYDVVTVTGDAEIQDTVDDVAEGLFLTMKILGYGLIIVGISLIFGRMKGYI